MESNGKSTTHLGDTTHHATGPIIVGEQGCEGQHTYHQLLHQGVHFIPVDFILVGPTTISSTHEDMLFASALSQSQALMRGKTYTQAFEELIALHYSSEEAASLAKQKAMPGNRPSNTLFINKISPKTLGKLIALYEHKIYVQGIIWNINSFDQWGVELGKQLLPTILNDLQSEKIDSRHDSSTAGLTGHYKKLKTQNS